MPNYTVFVPDTVQALIVQNKDFRVVKNSLTFKYQSGTPPFPTYFDLAHALFDYWRLRILPVQSDELQLGAVLVAGLCPYSGATPGYGLFPFPHGFGGVGMPNNVGFRVEFNRNDTERAHRGWNTLCGIPRSVVVGSKVTQTYADSVIEQFVGIGIVANTVGYDWVVTSTELAGVPRTTGITTPVTLIDYKDLTVDSARHRLPGRRI